MVNGVSFSNDDKLFAMSHMESYVSIWRADNNEFLNKV